MEKFGVRRSTILPLPSSPHCAPSTAMFILFRGASPRRTPLHAPSLAASPARSVRVAHSLTLVRFLSGGLRPAGLPYTLPRSPLRRLAPFACPTRCPSFDFRPGGFAPPAPPTRSLARRFAGSLRSRGSPAAPRSLFVRRASPRRTPLHAPSLAASPARSVRVAHSLTLVRFLSGGLRPAGPPYTLPRSPLRRLAPFAWLTR